jgi:hypothetical protein
MSVKPNWKAWLSLPVLVVALMLASACAPEESAPTSAPPSPLPNATPSRSPAPPAPPQTNPVEPGKRSKVEQDLKKDLGAPVIAPDSLAVPPPGKTKTPERD